MDPALIRRRYADRAAYLAAYADATDAAIAAGFVLAEDREAVLAEARPDLVDAATPERFGNGPDRSCPGRPRGAMIPGVMASDPDALRDVLLRSRSCVGPPST